MKIQVFPKVGVRWASLGLVVLLAVTSQEAQAASKPFGIKQIKYPSSAYVTLKAKVKFAGKPVVCLFVPKPNGFQTFVGKIKKNSSGTWWFNFNYAKKPSKPTSAELNSFKKTCSKLKIPEAVPTPTPTPIPTLTPTPTPTATPTPLMAESLSQYGVTWKFDHAYRYGAFANGDYWVVPDSPGGDVVVTEMSPEWDGVRHGYEVSPASFFYQGFDQRIQHFSSALRPTLPLAIKGGKSLVKAISYQADSECSWVDKQCLKTAAVLTVLSEVPPGLGAGLFRPPYTAGTYEWFKVADLKLDLIPSLPPPPGVVVPTFESMLSQLQRLQMDHFINWDRRMHPKENIPGYGSDISNRNSEAALRLMLNDSLQDKMPLLIAYVQMGIDLYGAAMIGTHWDQDGGHGPGRVLPFAFAATMLGHQGMKNYLANSTDLMFGENGGTFTSPVTGVALYGENLPSCTEDQYWSAMATHGVARMCRDPYGLIDGGDLPGEIYQSCCSSSFWKATATAFRILPELQQSWSRASFFEYTKRWAEEGAIALPDVCAPARGICQGSLHTGEACTTANAKTFCGSQNACAIDMTQYKSSFGPNPDAPGTCILDTDPSDGIGRFPAQDDMPVVTNWAISQFQLGMENTYVQY